jgi:hypothetical protein
MADRQARDLVFDSATVRRLTQQDVPAHVRENLAPMCRPRLSFATPIDNRAAG